MKNVMMWAAGLAALIAGFCLAIEPVSAAEGSPVLKQIRADADQVVVAQGDVVVTLGDVDTWMLDVPEKDRSGFIRSPERIENMLFQLLLMKQLVKEAEVSGVSQDPVIKRHMQQASDRTLARYQMDAARKRIKVPDLTALVAERYAANPENYREPDIATLAHLLITEGQRGSGPAEKLINKLYQRAKKSPKNFEALVAEYSEEPNAANTKGLIKDVALSTLDADFADAVRLLKPGQLSEPVKSQFGWHIIRLDELKLGRVPAFDEIKDALKERLEQEYLESAHKSYVADLRQRAMQPNAEVLEKLPFRYGGDLELPSAKDVDPKAVEEMGNKAAPEDH